MKMICCICQETIGRRECSSNKLATSFVWRNHGLCPACFNRARAAITRAYNQPAPPVEAMVRRAASIMESGPAL